MGYALLEGLVLLVRPVSYLRLKNLRLLHLGLFVQFVNLFCPLKVRNGLSVPLGIGRLHHL